MHTRTHTYPRQLYVPPPLFPPPPRAWCSGFTGVWIAVDLCSQGSSLRTLRRLVCRGNLGTSPAEPVHAAGL
eukprot:351479-Chlamydomonas_euryale.AAC.14